MATDLLTAFVPLVLGGLGAYGALLDAEKHKKQAVTVFFSVLFFSLTASVVGFYSSRTSRTEKEQAEQKLDDAMDASRNAAIDAEYRDLMRLSIIHDGLESVWEPLPEGRLKQLQAVQMKSRSEGDSKIPAWSMLTCTLGDRCYHT